MAPTILLAEDHPVVRQGIRAILRRESLDVVAEAADGRDAVIQAEIRRPDVAVLDIALPLLNGIDAAREIRRVSPDTRTILLTIRDENQYVVEALRAGATGYIVKSRAAEYLATGIREVFRGTVYLSPGISREAVMASLDGREDADEDRLSAREREVLQLVAEGRTTREVAAVLGISVKTAESYRMRIMDKLNIHQTATLVRYAIRRGIVHPLLEKTR